MSSVENNKISHPYAILLSPPNVLTYLRILCVFPIWFFLDLEIQAYLHALPSTTIPPSPPLNTFSPSWSSWFGLGLAHPMTYGKCASLLILFAGITDIFDGYIARRWHIETTLGKFLDPLADKLVLLVGLMMLMQLNRVPSLLVLLLLAREFFITGLRTIAIGEGLVLGASKSGKFKLIFQLLGLGLLMWCDTICGINSCIYGLDILYIALAISLVSGIYYVIHFYKEYARKH